jgi:hypothetical protein
MFNMLLPTAAGAYGYNTINNTEEWKQHLPRLKAENSSNGWLIS